MRQCLAEDTGAVLQMALGNANGGVCVTAQQCIDDGDAFFHGMLKGGLHMRNDAFTEVCHNSVELAICIYDIGIVSHADNSDPSRALQIQIEIRVVQVAAVDDALAQAHQLGLGAVAEVLDCFLYCKDLEYLPHFLDIVQLGNRGSFDKSALVCDVDDKPVTCKLFN